MSYPIIENHQDWIKFLSSSFLKEVKEVKEENNKYKLCIENSNSSNNENIHITRYDLIDISLDDTNNFSSIEIEIREKIHNTLLNYTNRFKRIIILAHGVLYIDDEDLIGKLLVNLILEFLSKKKEENKNIKFYRI